MDTFGWVILIFTMSKASLIEVPRAPYFKYFGLENIRDDVFGLASNGVKNVLLQPQASFTLPVQKDENLDSKAPQLFHHMVVNGKHVTAPLVEVDRKADVEHVAVEQFKKPGGGKGTKHHYSHGGHTSHGGAAQHKRTGGGQGGGDHYNHHGGNKASKHHSHHFHDSGKHGDSGKEEQKKSYGSKSGHKKSHNDGDKYGDENHKEEGGGHKSEFHKKAHKGDKHASKGYHDLHHKDEKKNLDSFYTNGHEEGKYIHYGKSNHKHGKEGYEKKNGKWQKKHSEESKDGKEKKSAKESSTKGHEQHGSKGSEGHAYNNNKEYSDGKATKGGKSYVVMH